MSDEPRHDDHAVKAEILNDLDLAAAASNNRARMHRLWARNDDLWRAAHWTEVARRTRQIHDAVAEGLLDRLAAEEDDDSYRNQYEFQAAWHTLRLYRGPDIFEPGEHDLIEVGHAAQCRTLPPGAVCWFAHDPCRDWWPVGYGTYRIRATQFINGGTEDGPNIQEGMDIQVLDETAGTWSDWHGPTRYASAADAAGEGTPV